MHVIAAKTPSVCIVFREEVKVERSVSTHMLRSGLDLCMCDVCICLN